MNKSKTLAQGIVDDLVAEGYMGPGDAAMCLNCIETSIQANSDDAEVEVMADVVVDVDPPQDITPAEPGTQDTSEIPNPEVGEAEVGEAEVGEAEVDTEVPVMHKGMSVW